MAALGSLVVSLEANTAQFTAGMDKAAYQTDKAAKQMQKDAAMVGKAIGAMGAVAAGALAVLIKNSIDAADNLRDMSQKTGIAVETLNGLGFAAGQAGGSLEGMVAAAGKLNKSIAEAGQGAKEPSEAFDALGISVRDASGELKKADVIMAEVADQFAKYQDGPEKAALALRLFGKAGADMIPLLNDGGTAMRENVAYAKQYSGATKELSDAADNFNDTLGKLAIQQKSFGNAMAEAVLPILQRIAEETLSASEASNKYAIASNIVKTVLETFVVVGSEVAFVFKAVGTEIGGIAAQLAALATFDIKGFNAISTAMKADAELARKEHDKFIADILNRTPAATVSADGTPKEKPNAPGIASGKEKKGETEREKLIKDAQRMIAKLKEQADAYGLTGAALLKYQLAQSKMPQQYKDEAMALQIRIDALNANSEADKQRIEDQKKASEEAQRAVDQNAASVERIRSSLLSELDQEKEFHQSRLDDLQTFHDLKLENVIQANALIEAENARHEQAKADMQMSYNLQAVSMAADSSSQLYSIMKRAGMEQSALGKALFYANKALAVAEILINTEIAAAKALALGPIIGVPLSFAIRTMGYASAGLTAGMAISGEREKGGSVWAGGAFVVGEKGPEIFKPTGSGTIIPNNQIGGAGSGEMKLTIVNNTSAKIGNVVEQRISATERALIIQEAVGATAAQLGDPNSKTSRSMGRNFTMQRSR